MEEFTPEERSRLNVASQSSDAVRLHLGAFAVSMIDLGGQNTEVGSGTLIDVYGHLLIATAEHCIPANPNGRLWLLTSTPRRPSDGMIGFVRRETDHTKDVGLLELDPSVAFEYFKDKQSCQITRVKPAGVGRDKALVSLIGTPADRVDANQEHQGYPAMAARLDSYSTVVLSPNEWEIPPGVVDPPNTSTNVGLYYPDEVRNLQTNVEMKAYHPGGFSGGGIWDQHYSSDGVWSAQKATLYGMLSGWYGDKWKDYRDLFGIQIIHWLRLVHNHYPDVREKLESQFPEIIGP